jgi:hypothetical protein
MAKEKYFMRHLNIAGLCLVAVLAISMIAANAASATRENQQEAKNEHAVPPFFLFCQRTFETNEGFPGEWEDEQCSKLVEFGQKKYSKVIPLTETCGLAWLRKGGNYNAFNVMTGHCETKTAKHYEGELLEIERETFSSTGGAGLLETVGGKTLRCAGNTDRGQITGPKEVGKVFVTFTGCEEPEKKVKCKTMGKAEGEIATLELKGHLGYLEKSVPKVGLVLEPTTGTLFAELLCPSAIFKIKINGKVIAEISSALNTLSTTGELHYALTAKGRQVWTKFEGGVEEILKDTFSGGAEENSAIEGQDKLTYQNDVQIVA